MSDFDSDYEVVEYLAGWLGWHNTLYTERGW